MLSTRRSEAPKRLPALSLIVMTVTIVGSEEARTMRGLIGALLALVLTATTLEGRHPAIDMR